MERKDAISVAQEFLTDVLKGNANIYEVDDRDVVELLSDLVSIQKEMIGDIEYAKRELDHALPFLNGGEGRFNSLGILQSTGSRIDMNAALFHKVAGYAKSALVGYFEKQ